MTPSHMSRDIGLASRNPMSKRDCSDVYIINIFFEDVFSSCYSDDCGNNKIIVYQEKYLPVLITFSNFELLLMYYILLCIQSISRIRTWKTISTRTRALINSHFSYLFIMSSYYGTEKVEVFGNSMFNLTIFRSYIWALQLQAFCNKVVLAYVLDSFTVKEGILCILNNEICW